MGDYVHIICDSAPAPQAIRDPRNTKAHAHALMFRRSLTICLSRMDTRFCLVWSPRDRDLEGRQMTQRLATECQRGRRSNLHREASPAYQKAKDRLLIRHQCMSAGLQRDDLGPDPASTTIMPVRKPLPARTSGWKVVTRMTTDKLPLPPLF
jgi:hypothetical protein